MAEPLTDEELERLRGTDVELWAAFRNHGEFVVVRQLLATIDALKAANEAYSEKVNSAVVKRELMRADLEEALDMVCALGEDPNTGDWPQFVQDFLRNHGRLPEVKCLAIPYEQRKGKE
jgi:hypothetical protein